MSTIDVEKVKKHLEQVVEMYRANGLLYGMADVITPDETEESKMLVALFLTVLDKLECMPFSVTKEEVVKQRALVLNVETSGAPEVAFRHRVFFRIDSTDEPVTGASLQ